MWGTDAQWRGKGHLHYFGNGDGIKLGDTRSSDPTAAVKFAPTPFKSLYLQVYFTKLSFPPPSLYELHHQSPLACNWLLEIDLLKFPCFLFYIQILLI